MGCCDTSVEPRTTDSNVRGCTDVFWLCIYILFWGVMILIAAFSFVYGSPIRLINGYDTFGNTCGKKHNQIRGNLELSGMDTLDKPYLFFMDIKDLKKTLKVCVKQCPTRHMDKLEDLYKFYQETGTNLCRYDINFTQAANSKTKDVINSPLGPCPKLPVYESTSVLNRCVPKPVKDVAEQILSNFYGLLNSWDTLEQILGDLYNTWWEMLGLAFLAFLLSLFTVSIMHLLASLVSYIVMILVSIACIAGTSFLWYTYVDIKYNLDKVPRSTLLLESVRNETAFLWYSIIATIITVIILILVIVMRKQVDFLAELFRDTSKCLAAIPGLFFQPLVTFVVLLAFFAFWLFVVLCLATAYYPGIKGLQPFKDSESSFSTSMPATESLEPMRNITLAKVNKFTIVEYVDPMWVKYMWWFYFIGLIWSSEFIMACQQMVIAGSVAHWFYRHQYKTNDHVTYAYSKLIKYHLGSMAIGSLLITIFKVPRLILTYISTKLKKEDAGECAKCCLGCCICCFYCLEKFIRYLNHNAYTVIAIDGVNFCSAAKTAFEVLIAHSIQVATINSLGDFILFLGKCFVTAATGSVGLFFFRKNAKLTFYAAPTLLVCIFSFFIAHCILSLYEMVLDTLYLCKCQNEETRGNVQMENLNQAPVTDNGQTELAPMT
ncbi:Choline transporter-like 1 [Carabus blaptoides fortunei]